MVTDEVHHSVKRMADGRRWSRDDLRVMHGVGRELEGFEQLWPNRQLFSDHARCVDFYLAITHAARRAALQTVVAMREIGLLRDLAMLIARLVYQSRGDAVAWCMQARKKRDTKKRRHRF